MIEYTMKTRPATAGSGRPMPMQRQPLASRHGGGLGGMARAAAAASGEGGCGLGGLWDVEERVPSASATDGGREASWVLDGWGDEPSVVRHVLT